MNFTRETIHRGVLKVSPGGATEEEIATIAVNILRGANIKSLKLVDDEYIEIIIESIIPVLGGADKC